MKLETTSYKKFTFIDIKESYSLADLEAIAENLNALKEEFESKFDWIDRFEAKYPNPDTWETTRIGEDVECWTVLMDFTEFEEAIYGDDFNKIAEEDLYSRGNNRISKKIMELYEQEFGIIDEKKMIADPKYSCCYFYFNFKEDCSKFIEWSYEKFIKPTIDRWKTELHYEERNQQEG